MNLEWTEIPNDEIKLLRKGVWKDNNSPAIAEFYIYDGVDRKDSLKVEFKFSMLINKGFRVVSEVTADNYNDKLEETKQLCCDILNEFIRNKRG